MTTPSDMKPSERIFAGNKSDSWSLADHRAALSVIAKERDNWKFDAEYNVKLSELREAKRLHQEADEECQKLDDVVHELGGDHERGAALFLRETHAALTAANERAARLESKLSEWRTYGQQFRASKREPGRCLNCEEPRHEHYSSGASGLYCSKYDVPSPVATGERPIVVNSVWRRVVTKPDEHEFLRVTKITDSRWPVTDDAYRTTWSPVVFWRELEHVSDPPTPATGGEGE